MRNLRLDLCYDGTKYKGWQRLPGAASTIQGKLEQVLSRILDEPIEVIGSGRTDSGTHALGQVANFHCNSRLSAEKILEGLRQYLPEDIGVYGCRDVSPRFHARLNAKKKTYRYRIWNSAEPCVFDRKYVYILQGNYDLDTMRTAANYFIGTHDFSAFCGNKNMKKSTIRHIYSFKVERIGNELVFTVAGNGFLQHMVRIMIGTLLCVGSGEKAAADVPALFGGERAAAGPSVPACGLCLMGVEY